MERAEAAHLYILAVLAVSFATISPLVIAGRKIR
jgi:hypothetical protein